MESLKNIFIVSQERIDGQIIHLHEPYTSLLKLLLILHKQKLLRENITSEEVLREYYLGPTYILRIFFLIAWSSQRHLLFDLIVFKMRKLWYAPMTICVIRRPYQQIEFGILYHTQRGVIENNQMHPIHFVLQTICHKTHTFPFSPQTICYIGMILWIITKYGKISHYEMSMR